MKLVIGGYAQGKLNYVLQKEKLDENAVWDGCLPKRAEGKTVIINHFHDWMKEQIIKGNSPEETILSFLDECKDCIIISDEIGNGIVPLDALEREYRERTGRILVELAKRAEEVERVICGIGQTIKSKVRQQAVGSLTHVETSIRLTKFYHEKPLPDSLTENVTLVLIRHGETKANRERRYLGKTDEALSQTGKEVLLKYKKRNVYPKVDYLFSSPMKRCLETAGIIYPGLCPMVIPEWEEMDFGLFEYQNHENLKEDVRYQEWLNSNGLLPFPEGESREAFVLRCEKGFEYMCEYICRIGEGKTGTPVTAGMIVHGGTIMALLSLYGKGDYFDYQVSNGKGYLCRIEKSDGAVWMTEPRALWEESGV